MAFARPTYAELVTRIAGDMRSQLLAQGKRADPLLRRSKMWVLSRVYAAIYHVLYEVLEWISLQILPSTATDIDYLVSHGVTYAITRLPATKATGMVRFTGDDTTVIASGTEFVRDDGEAYVTTAEAEIGSSVSGQVDVAAEAVDAGGDGNMDDGTALSLSSPIAGVDAVAWLSGFDDGTDLEELEELRTRLLERTATTPHGGASDDYVIWAKEINGVFRVLPVGNARGAGTVDVYFLHEEGTGIGIPTSGQIAAVQAHLDDVRPVTADVLAKAPSQVSVAFTFTALDPDTEDVRDAIEAELDALFLSKALVSGEEEIAVSEFYVAVAGATDLNSFTMTAPATAQTAATGEVLVRGTITWPS